MVQCYASGVHADRAVSTGQHQTLQQPTDLYLTLAGRQFIPISPPDGMHCILLMPQSHANCVHADRAVYYNLGVVTANIAVGLHPTQADRQ